MGVFRLIGAYVAYAWRFSLRTWLRFALGYGRLPALFIFLFLIFFPIGLILVLLGFDLGQVDAWIDAQGGWLDAVGSFLFRLACGLVLLLCLFMIGGAIFDRGNPERPGFGCAALALAVGYFAWFGVIG